MTDRIALQGISETAPEGAFPMPWWFEPFGIGIDRLRTLLPALLPYGQPPDLSRPQRLSLAPLPPGEPDGLLLVAHPPGLRIALVLARNAQGPELVGACPVLPQGVQTGVRIERVLLAPHRLEALIEVTVGDMALTFLDPLFLSHRGHYHAGAHHDFTLSALALTFGPADTTPITIPPEAPSYAVTAGFLPPERPGDPIVLQTDRMRALVPQPEDAPHCYWLRGPVLSVRESLAGPCFGGKLWLVRVCIGIDETRGAEVAVDIALPEALLGRPDPPIAGVAIEATVLLQGQLWDTDTEPRK